MSQGHVHTKFPHLILELADARVRAMRPARLTPAVAMGNARLH
jgi:hypothetical protein